MRYQAILGGLIVATTLNVPSSHAAAPAGGNFVSYMTQMQYFTHKLGLAVTAQNRELEGYYVHEVEEIIEQVSEVEEYKGIPVGQLIRDTLLPTFEYLEKTLQTGDAEAADVAYDKLIEACNACHKAAKHEFIRIERRTDNPYLQGFTPAE